MTDFTEKKEPVTTIGLDRSFLEESGENWDSPEAIIYYVKCGLGYLNDTTGIDDPEVVEKRNRWVSRAYAAIQCIEVL